MTSIQRSRLILTAGIVVLLGGCTSVSSGEPRPAEDLSPPSSVVSQPTRPRDIKLDDVDPCTLLPQTEFSTYDITDPGKPTKAGNDAPACLWNTETGYFGVSLVTYEGIEAQEGRYGEIEPTEPVADFPAYVITLPDDDMSCFIAVDVAEGQYLKLQAGLDTVPDDIPTLCEYAHQFTESLMKSLT